MGKREQSLVLLEIIVKAHTGKMEIRSDGVAGNRWEHLRPHHEGQGWRPPRSAVRAGRRVGGRGRGRRPSAPTPAGWPPQG